jgi:hypothetical protein
MEVDAGHPKPQAGWTLQKNVNCFKARRDTPAIPAGGRICKSLGRFSAVVAIGVASLLFAQRPSQADANDMPRYVFSVVVWENRHPKQSFPFQHVGRDRSCLNERTPSVSSNR